MQPAQPAPESLPPRKPGADSAASISASRARELFSKSSRLEACDADYRTVVITDCCADTDLELHRVLIERLFPLRGEVMTAAEFVKAIG